MKLIYIYLCLAAFILASCYNDLGNYDYQEINDIRVIGGVNAFEDPYNANTGLTILKIEPVLSFSQDSLPAERFEYGWYVFSTAAKNGAKMTKISDKRDLEYLVDLPVGSYYLLFRAKDTKTGVETTFQSGFNVKTVFTNGWMFLGENAGNVVVDMASISSSDTTIITDVLKKSGLPTLKGPRKLISLNQKPNSWEWTSACFIMTDDGTFELDKETLKSDLSKNFRHNIYYSDASEHLAGSDMLQHTYGSRIFVGDNDIYISSTLTASPILGVPINKTEKYGTFFKAWPEIAWPVKTWGILSGSYVAYDMDGKRFVSFTTSSSTVNCTKLADKEGDPFDWVTGNEMVALFNSRYLVSNYPTSYAVMKSPDNHYYLYSFQTGTVTPRKGNRFDITDLPGIAQATKFIFSGNNAYMLYAVGNQLYGCEFLASGVRWKEFDGFGGDEITMLHLDTYTTAEGAKNLDMFYVATYNATTGGTVHKYQIKNTPDDIVILKKPEVEWKNLCKVTSMCWKWY